MRGSKYTRAVLLPLVQTSTSITEVLRKLGLRTVGGNYRHISRLIRFAEIDISHFHGSQVQRCRALTREQLEPVVRDCHTVAQVAARLGLPVEGRPHRELARRLRELELSTDHFRGSGWNRGETAATHPSVRRAARSRRLPDEEVFIANSRYSTGRGLTRRLLALGWTYACRLCGISSWQGRSITLHVDHINGINNDHRLPNLRFLCPNCHSQTENYAGKRNRACDGGIVLHDKCARSWRNWFTR